MAGTALLERELEKLSEEQKQQRSSVSEAEKEHDRLISENYQKLISNEEAPWSEPYAYNAAEDNFSRRTYELSEGATDLKSAHVPEYQQYQPKYHAPIVPSSVPGAPSAAQRIADYVPVRVGMQSLQRFGDMPAEPVRNRTAEYAPAAQPIYAPVYDSSYTPAAEAPARPRLFEGLTYKNGELYDSSSALEAPVYDSSYAPVREVPVTPAAEQTDSEEDALPTQRTMESVRHAEEAEPSVGFFASLSLKTKVVLAAVVAAIVLMIAGICINTTILNSVQAEVLSHQEEISRLSEQASAIQAELDYVTDPETIAEWALSQNMTK